MKNVPYCMRGHTAVLEDLEEGRSRPEDARFERGEIGPGHQHGRQEHHHSCAEDYEVPSRLRECWLVGLVRGRSSTLGRFLGYGSTPSTWGDEYELGTCRMRAGCGEGDPL